MAIAVKLFHTKGSMVHLITYVSKFAPPPQKKTGSQNVQLTSYAFLKTRVSVMTKLVSGLTEGWRNRGQRHPVNLGVGERVYVFAHCTVAGHAAS